MTIPRYVAIADPPRQAKSEGTDWYGWQDPTHVTTIQVHEPVCQAVKTGLLDHNGVPIYRLPEFRPIGFRVWDE